MEINLLNKKSKVMLFIDKNIRFLTQKYCAGAGFGTIFAERERERERDLPPIQKS